MTKEWLSLKDAAQLLGVHPSTVRLWSDRGILPTHKTQGGHRRYRSAEITLWLQSRQKSRDLEPERIMQEIVKSVRLQISEGRLEEEDWYKKLDDEARMQYRMGARSIFHGLMSHALIPGADAHDESYAIGYEYASRARRYNLSHVDAVRAFLFFRNSLIESVIKVYRDANVPSGQTAETFGKMYSFTDGILVSMLQTYETMGGPARQG